MIIEFFVPREVIIDRPGVYIPLVGRAEWTHFQDKGEIYKTEIWEDRGDDGHTSYELVRTSDLTKEQFHQYLHLNGFQLMYSEGL